MTKTKTLDVPEKTASSKELPSGRPGIAPLLSRPRSRSLRKIATFLLIVVIPVLASIAWNLLATDRYAARTSFVVRGVEATSGASDMMASLTGMASSGSTRSDSYIVRNYLLSSAIVRLIDERWGMENLYSRDGIDPLQRMWKGLTFEEKHEYWQRRIITTYDNTTGIITAEVQAFDPNEALEITETLIREVDTLVNELSLTARRNMLQFAENEVQVAAAALRAAQDQLRDFRSEKRIIDVSATALADSQLLGNIQSEIVQTKTALGTMTFDIANPPANVIQLKRRIESLEAQEEQLRARIENSEADRLSASTISEYERLKLEVELAAQIYTGTRASLESARRDALSQQRYLAIFEKPFVPEYAEYPWRYINILLSVVAAFLFWAISGFILRIILERRQ